MSEDSLNFLTPNLEDIDIVLAITCRDEFKTNFLIIWYELMDEFSFLSDIISDYLEPGGKLLESLERMDRTNQPAWNQPISLGDSRKWLLLVSEHFFLMDDDVQKAVLLHEFGHILVFEKEILKELRSQWKDGEDLFHNFCSIVSQNTSWYTSNLPFLKEIYEKCIFDILKIPGEIFANIWVKQNCNKYLPLIIEAQFNNYIEFEEQVSKQLSNMVLKYVLFCSILRYENLLIVINKKDNIYDEISEKIIESEKELSSLLGETQYNIMNDFRKEILKICPNLDEANLTLFEVYKKFVETFRITPSDFHPINE